MSIWQTLSKKICNIQLPRLMNSVNSILSLIIILIIGTAIVTCLIVLFYLNIKAGFKDVALSSGLVAIATLVLALAAFWAIWQNYSFRKEARRREYRVRSAEELYRWAEESLRLFYLPYNYYKDEIYNGLIELVSKSTAATTAAIIVGDEFIGLAAVAEYTLTHFYSAIKAKREEHKQVDESILEEFKASFSGLIFYLNLLRTWDYDYDAFIKDARTHGALPLSQHLRPTER